MRSFQNLLSGLLRTLNTRRSGRWPGVAMAALAACGSIAIASTAQAQTLTSSSVTPSTFTAAGQTLTFRYNFTTSQQLTSISVNANLNPGTGETVSCPSVTQDSVPFDFTCSLTHVTTSTDIAFSGVLSAPTWSANRRVGGQPNTGNGPQARATYIPPPLASVSVSSSPNPSYVGQTVTLTATVNGNGNGTPTGTVTFYDDTSNTTLGTSGLSGSTATFQTTEFQLGSNNFHATYNGNGTYGSASGSSSTAQNVTAPPFTLTSTASATRQVGQTYSQTNVASNGTPTYSYALNGGSLPLGTSLGSNGTVSGTPTTAGSFSYTIKATDGGSAQTASQTISGTIAQGVNTITFTQPANTPFTSAPPTLSANASSGLPVSFTSSTNPVCTVTSGVISFVSAGSCTITASQAGDTNYAAATSVPQTFNVTQGVNTITFTQPANTAFTSTPPTLSATASSNLPVSYTSTTAPVCTVTSGGVITFVSAGSCSITASQAGNTNYAAATSVPQAFNVTQGVNTITFTQPANTPFTSTPSALGATASSNLPVSYTSTTAPVCTVTSGGVITFVSAGSCSITASQAGNTNYVAATSVAQAFNVTQGVNTITFTQPANTPFTSAPPTLAATASSNLPVSYTSTTAPVCTVTSGGVITFVSAGSCSITASQAGNANYVAATSVSQAFNVTQGVNTITFTQPANTAFTSTPPTPGATASSNLPVSYTSTTAPVCTVTTSGVITFVSAGSCSITASQAGNANYVAATSVSRAFNVTPGVNTITFPQPTVTTFTSTPFNLTATATSGLAVTYISTTTSICTVSGSAVTLLIAGQCSITASQAGNANYVAATPVTQSFTVGKSAATVTVTSSPGNVSAGQSVTLTATVAATAPATGTPGGMVTFKDGATVLGTGTLAAGKASVATAALSGGAHTIIVSYSGDAAFNTSTSSGFNQTIAKSASTVVLTSSATPSTVGQSVTLTATVTVPAGTPTGTVNFIDGSSIVGSADLSSGSASYVASALAAGGHSLTAAYVGDVSYNGATSQPVLQNVTLSCNDNFGQALPIAGATGTVVGSTTTATGEAGEPDPTGTSAPARSVWCAWTAPASGKVTIDTTGSNFDTTLGVYTGTSFSVLKLVAANDNISVSQFQSRVSFVATQGTVYQIVIGGKQGATGNYVTTWSQPSANVQLYAAVLPSARSVVTGTPATAFETIINAGTTTANGCGPSLPPGFPATFTYQITNTSNERAGSPDTLADIAAGGSQNYVFSITPLLDLNSDDVPILYNCANAPPVVTVSGLNTLLLSSSATPSPDLISVAATLSNDAIVNIPGPNGATTFAASTINIGAPGLITASIDDNGAGLAMVPTLCASNPLTAACVNPASPAASITLQINTNDVVTFTIVINGTGNVPFDPANGRLFLRFKSQDGVTRGATSVAVRTK